MPRSRAAWAVVLAGGLAVSTLGGCTTGSAGPGAQQAPLVTPSPSAVTPSASSTPSPTAAGTVWLCRPGAVPDPCTSDRTATAVAADGSRHAEAAQPLSQPVDCFYVYPTVSREPGANSDLVVQPVETDVAVAQASRFSQVCRVWAPMYRQRTVTDLLNLADARPTSLANRTAYASVLSAWRDYLAHDNHGRRVVFIGHSQGAAMLVRLLRAEIDPSPALRRRTALAILLGANVTTQTGRSLGGSFAHLPLCTRAAESGCVIAYSSFPGQPPSVALFGRPGTGVSSLSGETASAGLTVACVNPAGIGTTGIRLLHPYVPTVDLPETGVTTPWVSAPGQFTAECRTGDGASWLQVRPVPGARSADLLRENLGPAWGYHLVDVTIALGDLVADVAAATRAH